MFYFKKLYIRYLFLFPEFFNILAICLTQILIFMKKNDFIFVNFLLLLLFTSCQKSTLNLEKDGLASNTLSIYLANGGYENIAQNKSFREFILKNIQEDFATSTRSIPIEITNIEVVNTDMEKSTFVVEYKVDGQENNTAITLWNILSTDFNYDAITKRIDVEEAEANITYKTRYKCVRETCTLGCSVRVWGGGSQITCFCGSNLATEGSCILEIL